MQRNTSIISHSNSISLVPLIPLLLLLILSLSHRLSRLGLVEIASAALNDIHVLILAEEITKNTRFLQLYAPFLLLLLSSSLRIVIRISVLDPTRARNNITSNLNALPLLLIHTVLPARLAPLVLLV